MFIYVLPTGKPFVPNMLARQLRTLRPTSSSHQPELKSCVKVEVAVLGSPSLVALMVSVDIKQR